MKKRIFLVLSGVNKEIEQCLRQVDCWQAEEDSNIVVIGDLNAALEWCENALLRSFYKSSKVDYKDIVPMTITRHSFSPMHTFSPRHDLQQEAFEFAYSPPKTVDSDLLKQCITDIGGSERLFEAIQPLFHRKSYTKHSTVWHKKEQSHTLYIIEKGACVLTDEYYEETILPGMLFGCLGVIANRPRQTNAVTMVDCQIWELSEAAFNTLGTTAPDILIEFIRLIVTYTDLQMSHISRQLFLLNK